MTELDVFAAIGALPDALVAGCEGKARSRRWVLVLIAAVLVVLAAACAIALGYRFIPCFGVMETEADIYTNAEPVAFDYQGESVTAHILAAEDALTVVLHSDSDSLDQAAASLQAQGSLSDEGFLQIGGTDYVPTRFTQTTTSTGQEWVYEFAVPSARLSVGQTLQLTLWRLGAAFDVQLAAAQSITELSDVGSTAQSEWFDVAVQAQQTEAGLEVQLYHINRTGMEFVSYGLGGGYLMVEPNVGQLCLQADGQEVPSDGVDDVLLYPRSFTFQVEPSQGASLMLPFVVLRDEADIHLEQRFSSIDEALTYQEDVALPYCVLHFFIEQGAEGRLRLTCTVTRTSEEFRLVGLGRPDDEIGFIIMDEGDEGPVTSSLVSKTDLTDTLAFSLDIPSVTYALITDFEISLD